MLEVNANLENDKNAVLHLQGRIKNKSKEFVKKTGKILYDEVKLVTSKTYFTKSQLQVMGHPYAVRFPKNFTGIDDRYINKQKGDLNKSIRYLTRVTPEGVKMTLWANNPATKYLIRGTKKMRERDFFMLAYERCKNRVGKERKKFLDDLENEETQ